MPARKPWLSFAEQASLLRERGLVFDDHGDVVRFLSFTNYYRFSGYFRFWQQDPMHGGNCFREGTRFADIRSIYELDREFAAAVLTGLLDVEQAVKTQFAYEHGRLCVGRGYLSGAGFERFDNNPPVEELMLRELQRSKELSIGHYRVCGTQRANTGHRCTAECYPDIPIWVAVEAFSFGTISRAIGASRGSGVHDATAKGLKLPVKYLTGDLKAMVELRNRCAHAARLWNCIPNANAGMYPKAQSRAFKKFGRFSVKDRNMPNGSLFGTLVVADKLLADLGIRSNWILDDLNPILDKSSVFRRGIMQPKMYGDWNPGLEPLEQ